MYSHYQDKIAAGCKESFPLSWILAENILYLSTLFYVLSPPTFALDRSRSSSYISTHVEI